MKKLTYLLGAEASANALPVVNRLTERFEYFLRHFKDYLKNKHPSYLNHYKSDYEKLLFELKAHYTVDTYAKKLYLQNKILHSNEEYNKLIEYLSAYFLYEQLDKNITYQENIILSNVNLFNKELTRKISQTFDYRYDSFFASVLEHDLTGKIKIPNNINIVSWNYDSQLEKSFMNFSKTNYNQALEDLNVIGLNNHVGNSNVPCVIKLNGTAAFNEENKKCGDLFDFSTHVINNETFQVFKDILFNRNAKETSLRFAWVNNSESQRAIEAARTVLSESYIIVVIGYSFPYFNREVDREIFQDVAVESKSSYKRKYTKIYIQAPSDTVESIIKRFESIKPDGIVESFTEIDQFLIPNEF